MIFQDFHGCFLYIQNRMHILPLLNSSALPKTNFLPRLRTFNLMVEGNSILINLKKLLETNGIMRRIFCPYTSQQNGIAERKHRHLVETGLALLAQSHLSNTYWVEAFNTAIYLINRLPTTMLNDQSPFHVLLKQIPNYSLLRTFGCACYPLLRPYINHKLMFQSKQCIFLGYSSNHKGYRCLDPLTNRVYLSRHVVFDESVFPAKDTNHVLHQSSATTTTPVSDCSSSSATLQVLVSSSMPFNSSNISEFVHTASNPSNSGPTHESSLSIDITPIHVSPAPTTTPPSYPLLY
jgi:hypothetical protein